MRNKDIDLVEKFAAEVQLDITEYQNLHALYQFREHFNIGWFDVFKYIRVLVKCFDLGDVSNMVKSDQTSIVFKDFMNEFKNRPLSLSDSECVMLEMPQPGGKPILTCVGDAFTILLTLAMNTKPVLDTIGTFNSHLEIGRLISNNLTELM